MTRIETLEKNELGKFMGILLSCCSVGNAVGVGIASLFIDRLNASWTYALLNKECLKFRFISFVTSSTHIYFSFNFYGF